MEGREVRAADRGRDQQWTLQIFDQRIAAPEPAVRENSVEHIECVGSLRDIDDDALLTQLAEPRASVIKRCADHEGRQIRAQDRKSGVKGKRVTVRVDIGGRSIIKKK